MSDKNTVFSQFSIKNNRVISDDFDLSEAFGSFFENAVRLFNVKPVEHYLSDTENLSNTVEILKTIQACKLLSKIFQETETFVSLTLNSGI